MKDYLDSKGTQGKKQDLFTDGAYFDQDLVDEAKEKNIDMSFTNLVGRKPKENKISYTEFEMDHEKQEIVKCPNGVTPIRSSFIKGIYSAHYNKEDCKTCPFFDNCPINKQKNNNVVRFSEKRYKTEKLRKEMLTKEYKEKSKNRAAVEWIPSVLRRTHKVDQLPVMGLVRSKIHIAGKIFAMNFKKLHKGLIITT